MVPPPLYFDLGKQCRDLFAKGYHFGNVRVDLKTKSAAGINMAGTITQNLESTKTNANAEVKFKLPEYCAEFIEKWNTDNVIYCEINSEDKVAKGVKVASVSTFAPFTGMWSLLGKSQFRHDLASVNVDCDFFNGPTVIGSIVFGKQGIFGGYHMCYDTCKAKLTRSNIAAAYESKDISLHAHVDDGAEFGGSIYHRVKNNLEAGVMVGFTMGPNTTRLALCTKYQMDDGDTVFRAKLNNNSQLGLSWSTRIRTGINTTVSSLLDLRSLNQGGHKLGLALELEA
ncbi:unnamed protein product [Cyprideis torosa]|uniref:Uncharacterized protein n=1 Tax=Cyprideis torosa TaxID=163714 RepID=A0A7R8WC30_9CRUS|nr:unnamed protein product [Cyprideis torosa]CAG0892969.1 unnamed protein product [Cyprideis torosa]